MAHSIDIPGAGNTAKVRNPLGVLGLTLITLGIYGIFWWYFINREMADLGRANREPKLGDNPLLSVLAFTIGALIIIPPFVTHWKTLKRIETSQNLVLGSNNISPILLFILLFIPLVNLVVWPLMQSNLNQVWERGAASAATPAPAPEAPTA
jgi:amino acid transporter